MKKTSKLLALLLAFALVLTACGGGDKKEEKPTESGESATAESTDEGSADATIENHTDENTLVVGVPEMNGDLINGFTNSSYDVQSKILLGNYDGDLSYSTTYFNEAGDWLENPTVNAESPVRSENEDGSITYTMKLKDNLLWSDGTPITAKDYVFHQLFINSPEWKALGTWDSANGSEYLGYEAYSNGETRNHAAMHLLDDYSFSLTISKEYVPYFFETALVSMSPMPLHRYTPNMDVVDAPEGATLVVKEGYTISDEDKAKLLEDQQKLIDRSKEEYEDAKKEFEENGYQMSDYEALEPKLDALTPEEYDAAKKEGKLADGTELEDWTEIFDLKVKVKEAEDTLKEYQENSDAMDPYTMLLTMASLDISQNYRFAPDVTCGPYKFVSYGNGLLTLTLNDKFVGDAEGKKPTIPNVILQTVNQDLSVDLVLSGQIDLTAGETLAKDIEKAVKNEESDNPTVKTVSYIRNGYGNMPFITDMGATQYKGVRQAIISCLDRTEFVQNITGGYGVVVNGGYSVGQWEYLDQQDKVESELKQWTLNIDEGNAALDKDSPYKFEKDGTTPWDAAKAEEAYNKDKEGFDYWRYDDQGKQLTVYHEGTTNNDISDLIATQIPDAGKRMGMEYIVNKTDFATLLTHYYTPDASNPTAPTVFNMATSFDNPNDPYNSYHSSKIGAGNRTRTNDPVVDKITADMRKVSPDNKQAWMDGWLEFQKWFNDYIPEIPLYCNKYYDITTNRVDGMETSALWDWARDICDMSLAAN